jgi:RNA polymerase sigma factor (sigma-70 family)
MVTGHGRAPMTMAFSVLPSGPGEPGVQLRQPPWPEPLFPSSETRNISTLLEVDAGTAAEGSTLDRRLAARLMSGDPDALSEAFRQFGSLVLGISRRVLHDDRMAEDVTQEVFAFLWEHPERFEPQRGSLRSWLALLAHRRSVDRVRAETRHTRLGALAGPAGNPDTEADDRLQREWICGRVRSALDTLPAEQREVVVLAYFAGQSYREVAAELALPEGTVKSRIRLALRRLNDILRAELSEEEVLAWN